MLRLTFTILLAATLLLNTLAAFGATTHLGQAELASDSEWAQLLDEQVFCDAKDQCFWYTDDVTLEQDAALSAHFDHDR